MSQSSTVVLPKLGYLGSRTPSTIYKDLYLWAKFLFSFMKEQLDLIWIWNICSNCNCLRLRRDSCSCIWWGGVKLRCWSIIEHNTCTKGMEVDGYSTTNATRGTFYYSHSAVKLSRSGSVFPGNFLSHDVMRWYYLESLELIGFILV